MKGCAVFLVLVWGITVFSTKNLFVDTKIDVYIYNAKTTENVLAV